MSCIRLERDGLIASVALTAGPRNAITWQFVRELSAVVGELARDSSVRAVVVHSETPRYFSCGDDINEMEALLREDSDGLALLGYIETLRSVLDEISNLSLPTIAVIEGYATGGGMELAIACDLRFMSTEAQISLPEVLIGGIPGGGGTSRLTNLLGRARALDLLWTGRLLSAEEAHSLGLIEHLCPPGETLTRAKAFAAELAQRPPLSVQWIKRCVRRVEDFGLQADITEEGRALKALVGTRDLREGFTAFRAKRSPQFIGE